MVCILLSIVFVLYLLSRNQTENQGKFIWGRTSFAESASQIHLSLEGNEGIPFLHAQLNDRHGSQQSASINLTERIQNENGQLSYLEY